MFGAKEPVAAAEPADGKITLADVLARGWFELLVSAQDRAQDHAALRRRGAGARAASARGVLPPGVFLPGASEADMLALTERVIVTALRTGTTSPPTACR